MSGVVKAAVQEPSKIDNSGVLNKNTGFPEPLSPYRNTTLRHPSADTSPNASIEECTDVSTPGAHSRHSSFQHPRLKSSRHQPKSSLASSALSPLSSITPIDTSDGLYDDIQYADGTKEQRSVEELTREQMDAGAESSDQGKEDENENQRMESERDEQGYREGEKKKKKGVLRKLQLHKVS